MNKLLTLLLVTFVSCGNASNDDIQTSANIKCDISKITAEAAGHTVTLNIQCAHEWSAYSNEPWIKVEKNSQGQTPTSTQGSINVTIAKNTTTAEREGEVCIKSGITQIEVPITQSAPMFVSATEIYSASKGEDIAIEVTATNDWNVTTNTEWINAKKADNRTVMVTTAPNNAKTGRTGMLTITSGSENITVNVIQESAEDRDINTPEGYRLVWHDEFNEGTTPSNDWTHEVQSAGWVNNELQTYVNGTADGRRVTELKDGKLNINCFKGSDDKIYSARIYAKVNTGWTYGYFEARMLLPKGKGTWPAFWMMPVNNDYSKNPWPGCGEIDIMEEVGCVPNEVSSSIHCNAYNHTINTQKTQKRNIGTAESEYHVYACEWTEDILRFYVDGNELMTFRNEGNGKDTWPFTYAFYPILNLAWGGAWGGMNGVDESVLPVTLKVDYIRVFQKN